MPEISCRYLHIARSQYSLGYFNVHLVLWLNFVFYIRPGDTVFISSIYVNTRTISF